MTDKRKIYRLHVTFEDDSFEEINEYFEDRADAIEEAARIFTDFSRGPLDTSDPDFQDDVNCVKCELDDHGQYVDADINIELNWDWLHFVEKPKKD